MWTAAWPLASAACSQAASAAVAAWPWVLSALLGLFWAARLCLYAVLVSCAWITIIENDEPRPTTRLTSEALAAKEDAERAAAGGHHRPLTPSTDLGSVSESVDSLDDLFPDEGSSVSSETGAARGAAGGRVAIPTGPVAPATPTASPATPTAPRAVAARPPVAVRPAPRAGPVTVAKVATPAAPEPSLEEEVLPEEVKAVAADKGEKQVGVEVCGEHDGCRCMDSAPQPAASALCPPCPQALAAAALASGGGLGGGTGTADACEPSSRHHNKRKKKKPFLNRQLDKLFQLPSAGAPLTASPSTAPLPAAGHARPAECLQVPAECRQVPPHLPHPRARTALRSCSQVQWRRRLGL